jgi:hypothetical protein
MGTQLGWFGRLKGKSFQRGKNPDLHGMPTVKGSPRRPGLTPPAPPKKRGKAPEQWNAELAAYRLAMREHVASIAAFNRERNIGLVITSYQWVAVDIHGTCDVAKRNGGRVFSYAEPPSDGHVGEGKCNSPDWCRCFAKSVIPGFS